MKIKSKRVKWMTEIKSRCNHPSDDLILNFDLLDRPYYYCQKCGYDISIDEKSDRCQKSLWE